MKPIEHVIKDISIGGKIYTIMIWHLMITNDGIFDHQLNTVTTTNFNIPRSIRVSVVNDINNIPHL